MALNPDCFQVRVEGVWTWVDFVSSRNVSNNLVEVGLARTIGDIYGPMVPLWVVVGGDRIRFDGQRVVLSYRDPYLGEESDILVAYTMPEAIATLLGISIVLRR